MSMQAEPGIVESKSHEGQQEVDLLVDLRLLISEYIGNIVYNDKLETWDIIERMLFIVSIKNGVIQAYHWSIKMYTVLPLVI